MLQKEKVSRRSRSVAEIAGIIYDKYSERAQSRIEQDSQLGVALQDLIRETELQRQTAVARLLNQKQEDLDRASRKRRVYTAEMLPDSL